MGEVKTWTGGWIKSHASDSAEYVLDSDYYALASDYDALEKNLRLVQSAAKTGMDAAHTISSRRLQTARKLHAESSPECVESERAANEILTNRISALESAIREAHLAIACGGAASLVIERVTAALGLADTKESKP